MEQLQRAILHLKVNYHEGIVALKSNLNEISIFGKIKDVSTIYKRTTEEEQTLELAILIQTWGDVEHFNEALKKLKLKGEMHLLAFEKTTMLSPELTLPSPFLHTDGLIARCSAEVWSDYLHPLFKESLNTIAKNITHLEGVEYYKQNKVLFE